jgi:hypothetical protein
VLDTRAALYTVNTRRYTASRMGPPTATAAKPGSSQDGTPPPADNTTSSAVEAITFINLPAINCAPHMIHFHFRQIESLFTLSRMTKEISKYHNVIVKLTGEQNEKFADIIVEADNAAKPYTYFKTKVLQRFGLSVDQRYDILTGLKNMGDRKPSEFLTYLRLINNGENSINMIDRIWRKHLPISVRTMLIGCDPTLTLDEKAQRADECVAMTIPEPQSSHLYEVSAPRSQKQDPLPEMQVDAIQGHRQFRPRVNFSRGPQQQRPRSGSRDNRSWRKPRSPSPAAYRKDGNRPITNGLCFFHKRYGDKSYRCQPGCVNFKNFKPNKSKQFSGNSQPGKSRL